MFHRFLTAAAVAGLAALIQVAPVAGQETAASAESTSIATADAPSVVIQRYYDALNQVMVDAEQLGFEGRYDILEPVVRETFNMPFIASFTTGRYWGDMTPQEQERATEAVLHLSTATYAARFDKYSGEQFEIIDESETERGDLLVNTNIIDSKGKPVAINYVMRENGGAWRIVDVFLDGTISELATRRSEFTSVLRRQGYDGLISAIDRKVEQLKSE